jgi:hypothetical protein
VQVEHDGKVFHAALPASAAIQVWGYTCGRGVVRETLAPYRYKLASPLSPSSRKKSGGTGYENLAPFWAVARCGRGQARSHSMIYDYVTFDVPAPLPVEGLKWPRDTKKWKAKMPVLRNVRKLARGDLLSLPFFDPAEECEEPAFV